MMRATVVAARGHEKPPRLGENLDVGGKQPVNLGVDDAGQFGERPDVLVVRRGKAAADVENLDFMAARPWIRASRRRRR